jgi:hypothetical protein
MLSFASLYYINTNFCAALGSEAPDMNINIIIVASIPVIDHFHVKPGVKGSFRDRSVQQASLTIARWDNFMEFENLSPEDFLNRWSNNTNDESDRPSVRENARLLPNM